MIIEVTLMVCIAAAGLNKCYRVGRDDDSCSITLLTWMSNNCWSTASAKQIQGCWLWTPDEINSLRSAEVWLLSSVKPLTIVHCNIRFLNRLCCALLSERYFISFRADAPADLNRLAQLPPWICYCYTAIRSLNRGKFNTNENKTILAISVAT